MTLLGGRDIKTQYTEFRSNLIVLNFTIYLANVGKNDGSYCMCTFILNDSKQSGESHK